MVDMEQVAELCPDALKADGFDAAIIGFCNDIVAGAQRFIYDYNKMVEILVARDEMTHDEADEFLQFNTVQAFVGENGPIFMVGL